MVGTHTRKALYLRSSCVTSIARSGERFSFSERFTRFTRGGFFLFFFLFFFSLFISRTITFNRAWISIERILRNGCWRWVTRREGNGWKKRPLIFITGVKTEKSFENLGALRYSPEWTNNEVLFSARLLRDSLRVYHRGVDNMRDVERNPGPHCVDAIEMNKNFWINLDPKIVRFEFLF